MILCTKLIIPNLCLSTIAVHIPMTAFWLALGLLVRVHARIIVRKTGALLANSVRSFFHVKSHSSVGDWRRKIDLLLSLHIEMSSFRTRLPMRFRRCLRVSGSFKHSIATACLLLLATAFPMLFRLGVRAYNQGVLYPT